MVTVDRVGREVRSGEFAALVWVSAGVSDILVLC